MPTGKGFVDKKALEYILQFAKESKIAQELRKETQKHKCSQMISDLEVSEVLKWIVKLIQAKRTLEIGVFTGYSALTIAEVLPKDGTLIGVERKEDFVNIGKPYWKEAGVDHKIKVIYGEASDVLKDLSSKEEGLFDFAFIDADKKNHGIYFEYCMKLVRKGGVIAIDNVFFFGRTWDKDDTDKNTPYIREFNEKLQKDDRVELTTLPISDGLTLCFIK